MTLDKIGGVNARNLPPVFLIDCLRQRGYQTVPALASSLGVSQSWVRKLLRSARLRGRHGDLPKVITTGGMKGRACIWILADVVRAHAMAAKVGALVST